MKNVKKIIVFIMVLVMCLSAMNTSAFANDDEQSQEQTVKVDVGGFNLEFDLAGEGKPTVIFEHGLGGDRTWWDLIQPEIAKYCNTVSYDRAGAGGSDFSPNPRLISNMVEELHTALTKLDIKGPYIFVAHSFGGLTSRVYATKYPNEVAGIIFVDSSHEDMVTEMSKVLGEEFKNEIDQAVIVEGGTTEDFYNSLQEVRDTLPADALRNKPITVLTANNHESGPEADAAWMQLQDRIASLSNDSKHIIVDNGHFIPIEKPEVVIDAIFDMFERTGYLNACNKVGKIEENYLKVKFKKH